MDEYNSGMDPEVKQYFRKIINLFSLGLIWLLSFTTAGLFFGLALIENGIRWYNILFYISLIASLIFLVRYLYKNWNKKMG